MFQGFLRCQKFKTLTCHLMDNVATPATVLDKLVYGERDLILTLLTRDYGLVSAVAKAAIGSKKRFVGLLDFFVVFQAQLRQSRTTGLWLLLSADPLRSFPGILQDLDRSQTGQAMLLVARDILRVAPCLPEAFDLLCSGLEELENTPRDRVHMCLIGLCFGLIGAIGHVPSDARCPVCKGPLNRGLAVLEGGTIVCSKCGENQHAVPLRSLSDLTRQEAISFVTRVMSLVLGRAYRVPGFLTQDLD